MRSLKESDIQKLIMGYLAAEKVLAFRMQVGAMTGHYKGKKWFVRFGEKGMADILSFPHGGVLWIEVKTPIGRVTAEQESFERLVTNHGHSYVVARSLEDVQAELKGTP